MRNGLLLAVAIATLALLPAASYASAPIFQNVPAVIVLHKADGETTASAVAFPFDSSVYDKDNADDELAWSFIEYSAGLAVVQDVDGAGDVTAFESLDGIDPVASLQAARVLTSASASNLAGSATTFTLLVDTGTTGIDAGASVTYANGQYPVAATDDLYTTIIIAVTDGVNLTYKTVLVKADYDSTAPQVIDGDYENVISLSLNNVTVVDGDAAGAGIPPAQAPGVDFFFWDDGLMTQGKVTFSSDANSVSMTGESYGVDPGGLIVGWAYFQPYEGVLLSKNKVYRFASKVVQTAASLGDAPGVRMRFAHDYAQIGGYFIANPQTVAEGGNVNLPWSVDAVNGATVECLLELPVDNTGADRFSGGVTGLYNTTTTYKFYQELVTFGPTGTSTFSDYSITCFDAPASGKDEAGNGLLYYAGTAAEFTSSGTQAIAFANDNATPGWKMTARKPTTISFKPFSILSDFHQDQAAFYGWPATTVDDTITSIRCFQPDNEYGVNTIEIFHGLADLVYDELSFGNLNNTTDTMANSIVDAALLQDNLGRVYYRATFRLRTSGNGGDTPLTFPQINLMVGGPNAAWTGYLSMPGTSGANPVNSEWTDYKVWVRAPQKWYNTTTTYNNLMVGIETFDAFTTTGGTLAVDEVYLEMHPTSYYE